MKLKNTTISVIALFLLIAAVPVRAEQPPTDILIVELQVRSSASTGAADQEFVELYNTADKPIDVSTWKLQYKPATGVSWSDKVNLHGSVEAHSHYLLVSNKYPDPPIALPNDPPLALDVFAAGLSDSGGHIRIVDAVVPALPVVHDLVGWGTTANAAEGNAPAPAPAGGKSLQRHVNEEGSFSDTNNNANDFEVSATPHPQVDPLYIAPVPDPAPEPTPEPTPTPESEQTPVPAETPGSSPASADSPAVSEDPVITPDVLLASPQITELLPNPAAPASDSTDEFIELYNPNDQALDVKDYKLQSGNTFSYSYTFDTTILAAHEYRAFLVTQTGDILSNTSGQARLLDPAGNVIGQTNAYESASEGQAWALINGAWQWTVTPTPNEANILTAVAPKSVGIIKSSTVKTPSTPAKTTAKVTSAAKPKTSTAVKSAKTTATPDRQVYQDPAATPPTVHPGILAGVGVLTLLYAIYEYRYDAVNTFRRLQRYRSLRRSSRPVSSRR